MPTPKSKKNRERISRRRNEMHCSSIKLRFLTPKVRDELGTSKHPKLPNSSLSKLDYVEWLLDNGYGLKAFDIINPIAEQFNEPYDEHAYAILTREQETYGVPRTYR